MDELITTGPDRIEKPVSTLAMVPKTGAITRVGRQAYTVMMLLAREQTVEQEDTGMFTAPLNTVIKGFDGSKGTVEELKRHLRSMVTHVVEWQSPSPGEVSEWGACALLAEVRLTKKNGENWLSWAYPPSLRQEMLSPLRYAQIRRSTIAQFRSHAGLALYEICARYKDNPSHMTSKQHWHWWLPVLTGKPAQKEVKTEFRFFNRDTLKPAVEEVNEVSELEIRVLEFKNGRTIEQIQFEVRLKDKAKSSEAKPLDLTKLSRALLLGIDPESAEDLFIRYGELAFAKAIDKLESRLALRGTPILSRLAYLKTLLAGKVVDTQNNDALSKPVAAPIEVVENPVVVRQAKASERESERVKQIRSEIMNLDEGALKTLLSELRVHFLSRQVSASVLNRLDDGKWQSALVMGELMSFYWKKTRGTDWTSHHDTLPTVERIEQAGLF